MEDNIMIREDKILEIELPSQEKFYQIPLNSLDYIFVLKDEEYITLMLNNQQQINKIPIKFYKSLIDNFTELYDESFIDYKMNMVQLNNNLKEKINEQIEHLDIFINYKNNNIISIIHDEKINKIYITIKEKGTMIIFKEVEQHDN